MAFPEQRLSAGTIESITPSLTTDPAHLMDIAAVRQFVGAPIQTNILESAADRAVGAGRVLEDTLIVGAMDSGKQVIARALARDCMQRPVEVDGASIRNSKHMSRILRSLDNGDALLLRRVDELRPATMRMLVSLLGMRSLPAESDRGQPIADCTVIATAVTLVRRMEVLRRIFPLQVELPVPSVDGRVAAAFRAVQALGIPGSAELRTTIAERVVSWRGGINSAVDVARVVAANG